MKRKILPIDGWKLFRFIVALRHVEFSISLSDLENVLYCLQQYPELDVKIVLEVNFVHSSGERELFRHLWSLLMTKDTGQPEKNTGQKGEGMNEPFTGEIAPGGRGLGRGQGGTTLFPQTTQKAVEGLFSEDKVRSLILEMPLDLEELEIEKQTQWVLGQMNLLQWLNTQELAYHRGKLTEEELNAFTQLKVNWQKLVRQELVGKRLRQVNRWETLKSEHYLHRPLGSFTAEEKDNVQQALRTLGRKLAKRQGLRKRSSLRGEVSIERAMRKLIQGKGYIFHLEYQQRVPQRAELVVLCDVSNSVLPYSEFLLFLVQHMKQRFRKIKLFLFIDSLWDITQEENFNSEAEQKIQTWSRRNSSGYSDYGRVFSELHDQWLPFLSARSTVLILGDGRNNYRPSQAEYLKEIYGKVNRVYWLNPLEEKDWTATDNILKEYAPYCTRVFRCRTVKDLQFLVRRIF